MDNENNDNINFFIKEKIHDTNNDKSVDIMKNFEEEWVEEEWVEECYEQCENELAYFIDKFVYNSDELYYEKYTVNELLDICKYYEIDDYIKKAKYKKSQIINAIVYFESVPGNSKIIKKRHTMWAYMFELKNDPKMRKYIII